jgi:DNA processing protein
MTDKKYLTALYSFTQFGPARTKLLIKYFGSSKNAWKANINELVDIGLKKGVVEEFDEHRRNFNIQEYFRKLDDLSIKVLTKQDKEYPLNLLDLEDAPLILYVKGTLAAADINSVAIVGTRKMTAYGREVAKNLAYELANYGVTIVSGLALGIDAAAHKAALNGNGRCIAVLASGLDRVTPVSNINLARSIIKMGGAIVSESPLGTEIWRSSFPMRNRIISGLTRAVVVVEGARKSGTLLTASAAAEQGRQVFAVPGQITSPMSAAPHFLLRAGAKMVAEARDILEELNMQLKVDRQAVEKVIPSGKDEKKLMDILANEPLHLDELARITGLAVHEISARLTGMELKGLVRSLGRGMYQKL